MSLLMLFHKSYLPKRIYAWVARSERPAPFSNEVSPAEKGVAQVILFEHEGFWKAARDGDRKAIEALVRDEGKGIVLSRGAFGETILHQCLLFHKPEHLDLVNYLVQNHPEIINLTYLDPQYAGEHVLHMAAVKKNFEVVKLLCENGADCKNPRATGLFFSPKGSLYYGETVLAFAACSGDSNIVKYLITEQKVDPNDRDSYGNTVLHILAWWGMVDMYKFVKSLGSNPKLLNKDNLTPFLVAVERGHVQMVAELINDNREVAWEYGPISCFMYPLNEMDTFRDDETRHSRSALEIAVANSNEAMLKIPLFVALLDSKWVSFARQEFLTKLMITIGYIALFTAALSILPVDPNSRIQYTGTDPGYMGPVRLVIEVIIGPMSIINTIWKVILELKHHSVAYMIHGPAIYERVYDIFNALLMVAVISARYALRTDIENSILGFAAISGWMYLLYYAQGFRSLGVLVNIAARICIHDLSRWLVLYLIIIVGFAEALYLQMSQTGIGGWDTIGGAMMWMFRYSIGQSVYEDLEQAQVPGVAILFFTLEVFLTSILIINLFIALMSQTFNQVIEMAESRWRLQWATLILALERLQSQEQQAIVRVGFPKNQDHSDADQTYYLMFEQREGEDLPTSLVIASKVSILSIVVDWVRWQYRTRFKKRR